MRAGDFGAKMTCQNEGHWSLSEGTVALRQPQPALDPDTALLSVNDRSILDSLSLPFTYVYLRTKSKSSLNLMRT